MIKQLIIFLKPFCIQSYNISIYSLSNRCELDHCELSIFTIYAHIDDDIDDDDDDVTIIGDYLYRFALLLSFNVGYCKDV